MIVSWLESSLTSPKIARQKKEERKQEIKTVRAYFIKEACLRSIWIDYTCLLIIVKPAFFVNFSAQALLALKFALSIPVSCVKMQASCMTISRTTRRNWLHSSFTCAASNGKCREFCPRETWRLASQLKVWSQCNSLLPQHPLKNSQFASRCALVSFFGMENSLAALLNAAVIEHRNFFGPGLSWRLSMMIEHTCSPMGPAAPVNLRMAAWLVVVPTL